MITLFKKHPLLCSVIYLFVYQGLGSAIIGGGSEFGIAYGMYRHSHYDVTLWAFPNTISGDCALTLFIQVGLTWVVEEVLVGFDDYLDHTFEFPRWFVDFWYNLVVVGRSRFSRYLQWYFEVNNGLLPYRDENKFSNNHDVDIKKMDTRAFLKRQFIKYPNEKLWFNIVEWLLRKVLRAMLFACALFLFVWPISMGVFAATGTNSHGDEYTFNHYPQPQIMKLAYGAVIGIITTPCAIAVIVLRNRMYERAIKDSSFIFKVDTSDSAHILNFKMPFNVDAMPSQLFSPVRDSAGEDDTESNFSSVDSATQEVKEGVPQVRDSPSDPLPPSASPQDNEDFTHSSSGRDSIGSSLPKSIMTTTAKATPTST